MEDLYEVRELYGGVFLTSFDNNFLVPWKPLSMGDYAQYTRDYNRGLLPPSTIEDEIFKQCVVDKVIVQQMPYLRAGIVTTVVQNIWEYSGPVSVDSFNKDLEAARVSIFGSELAAIHQLVQTITMAFPYKPEEIYEMDYETFLLRLAQAERKLLDLHIIEEPLSMKTAEEAERENKKKPKPLLRKTNLVDAKKLWDEQQNKKRKVSLTPEPMKEVKTITFEKEVPANKGKWYEVSPVLETEPTHGINFNLEGQEQEFFGAGGHERLEMPVKKAQLAKQAQQIYAPLLAELAKRNKK